MQWGIEMPILGEIRTMASDVPGYLAQLHLLGWRECDGRSLNQLKYPKLFALLCAKYGGASNFPRGTRDEATSFRIPDLRGMFLRGVRGYSPDQDPTAQTYDDALADPDWTGRSYRGPGPHAALAEGRVGTVQGFALHAHHHIRDTRVFGGMIEAAIDAQSYHGTGNDNGQTLPNGGNETRPANAAVLYMIFAGTSRMQNLEDDAIAYPEGERMTQEEFHQQIEA